MRLEVLTRESTEPFAMQESIATTVPFDDKRRAAPFTNALFRAEIGDYGAEDSRSFILTWEKVC
jgi:hypothetical protein